MGARINGRQIIVDDPKLRLNDLIEKLSYDYLWSETELYMIAGYLYNHNSNAIIEIHSDYNAPNDWWRITKTTFNPKDEDFLFYQYEIDEYFKHNP